MIKSIINGLGSVLDKVAKIASAINKSTAFKLFKGFCSATVGIPLALVGTVVVGTAYLGMQAASTLSSQLIKSRWGTDLIKDIDWAPILEGTEKFMRSIWEDFGVYSHLKAAKFIGDQWAERQSEGGYGNAGDDLENPENLAALSDDPKKQAKIKPTRQDSLILPQKCDPKEIDQLPSPVCRPSSADPITRQRCILRPVADILKF